MVHKLGERRGCAGGGWRRHRPAPAWRIALTAAASVAAVWTVPAVGQPSPGGRSTEIYTCTDAEGRNHTSDRPIRACMDRPQRILNPDGTLRGVFQPPLTAREAADKEARERDDAKRAAAIAETVRRERILLQRYPNEESHQSSRANSLEPVRLAMELTTTRMAQLASERRTLEDEVKGLGDRSVPASLRLQLDANDAAVGAQLVLSRSQQAEFDRITRAFDRELMILKRLWAGAKPGTAEAGLVERGTASPAPPGVAGKP